jgi:hypothetical protein
VVVVLIIQVDLSIQTYPKRLLSRSWLRRRMKADFNWLIFIWVMVDCLSILYIDGFSVTSADIGFLVYLSFYTLLGCYFLLVLYLLLSAGVDHNKVLATQFFLYRHLKLFRIRCSLKPLLLYWHLSLIIILFLGWIK